MINIQHNIYNMEQNHSKIQVSQCYYAMAGKCKLTPHLIFYGYLSTI